jgi:hypothetical protein
MCPGLSRRGVLIMSARRLGVGAVAVLCVSLTFLVLGGAAALADKQYVPGPGSLFAGGEGSGDGQFVEPVGIAVNDSSDPTVGGDVYVVDKGNNRVERFSAAGAYLSQFNGSGLLAGEGKAAGSGAGEELTGQFSEPEAITVDNSGKSVAEDPSVGDVYVADAGHKVIDKFSATGEYKGQLTGTCASGVCAGEEVFEQVSAVAVDPSGNLWVAGHYTRLFEFGDTGSFTGSFDTGAYLSKPSLAVDAEGNAYVVSGSETVLEFASTTGVRLREFDPGSPALALDPATGRLVVDKGSSLDLYAPIAEANPIPEQTFAEEGLAGSGGLAINASGTAYASERGADEIESFATVLVPGTGSESASQIGETGEKLSGTVNPEGQAITDCDFEYSIYGTQAGVYPQSAPCRQASAEIGSGNNAVSVSAEVSGLRPGSTYHFRLKASNANGTAHGRDETFTVEQSLVTALSLPDDRAYELVSTIPGAEVDPPASGEPISYELKLGEIHGNTGGYRAAGNGETVAYVGGPSPSGVGGTGVSHNTDGNHYLAEREATGWTDANIEPDPANPPMEDLSSDLSLQIFASYDASFKAAHGGPADCLGSGGDVVYVRSGGIGSPTFSPLFTSTEGPNECYAEEAGISADDSHILLDSPFALTPGSSRVSQGEGGNLYDSVGGRLLQVNILPDGHPQPQPNATFGSFTGSVSPFNPGDYKGAISADGSRVIWTDLNTGIVYVRENDVQGEEECTPAPQAANKACTVQVSAGSARYWDATPDGRYVYYVEAGELLRFDTLAQTRDAIAGLGAEVQGMVGINEAGEDGGYVYFVADGVLTGANAEGKRPTAEQPNLYMAHNGQDKFIATLASSDNEFIGTSNGSENAGDWRTQPGRRTAEVASNGQGVSFMSTLPLTGYDNRGVISENEQEELFYGNQSEVFVFQLSTGRIACISCNPTGAPPAPTAESWESERGGYVSISGASTFMPRWINADGTQVYFNTSQPLVSRDTNHRQDLYEWQSDGSGGCTREEGCVELLSGGDAPADAYFLDASASGADVFFTSREQLVPEARDETVKVYDARVGGGFPHTSLACTGTGCQGVAPAPPIFATPASVTFAGVGNFPPAPTVKTKSKPKNTAKCKRGLTKKKGKCVKQLKKKVKRAQRRSAKKGRK